MQDTSVQQTQPGDAPSRGRWDVSMDLDGFRELFLAQQRTYQRKVFLMGAILCGLLTVVAVAMLMDDPGLDSLLYMLFFLALTVVFVFLLIKPQAALGSRQGEVRQWFSRHGERDAESAPLGSLNACYSVTLCDLGFTEDSELELTNVPWAALSEKPVRGKRGTYFVVDNGKESSLLHNMIGINWAFRDEGALGVLFVPNDVSAACPGLIQGIEGAIHQARVSARGADTAAGARLSDWLRLSGPKA